MTYPPVFGPVQDVLALRVGRLLLHAAMVLLALLGALLSGSFLFQSNKKRGLLSVLMCLCLAVVTGYPLYHGLFITGVQPLYTLEPSCYYGLLLLAVLLQGELYALSTKHKCIISLPCAAGLFFTLIRYGTAALLPAGIGLLFSLISEFLKYYTAAVLLGLSFWALWREKYHSGLMLCGAVAFAACLIVDRLFPVYEPICGGWFGEVGGVLLALSLAAALWLDAVESYRFRLTYQESFLQMQRRLDMQKEHYNQLSDQVRLAREASHDLRHHMRTMRTFAQQAQWDRLNQYLCDYESHVKTRDITLWSAHPAADAVLNHYAAIAEELDAVYDVRLTIPPELPLPDSELCILLSNLLENATEALARQTEGPRQLYLRGEVVNGRLGIVVDNTFSGQVRQQNGIYLSTKHSSHGLGLSSVTTIVEKHGGLVDFSHNNRLFHASIMIPLPAFRTEELPL